MRERGGDDRRGERVRKEIGAGALAEELDDLFAAGGVASAGAAEGFAEGSGDDVDAALDAAVLGGSAAVGADEADGVGVVDHDHGVVFFGEVADLGELGEVAIHGEDAVGGDEAMAGAGGGFELGLEVVHIAVAVAEAGGLREADAVDDAGVVELVGDDGVFGVEDGLEEASVGVEAGAVEDGFFGAEEGADALLELGVDGLGSADEADAGEAVAPFLQGLSGGGDDGGMVG